MEHFRAALAMYRALAEERADQSSETEALAFIAQIPRIRDGLLDLRGGTVVSDFVYPELVWPWKGLATRTVDRRRLATRAASADPKATALAAEVTDLRHRRADLLLAAVPADPGTRQKRDDDIAAYGRAIGEAEQKLRSHLPAIERAAKLSRATPADLQKALPADAVLVDILAVVAEGPVPPQEPAATAGVRRVRRHRVVDPRRRLGRRFADYGFAFPKANVVRLVGWSADADTRPTRIRAGVTASPQ